jgi:2-polyprenyl-3-methyl-5-hydroxy-6-metoxy-1,4-benzoquinol methylase
MIKSTTNVSSLPIIETASSAVSSHDSELPIWWDSVPPVFREQCSFVDLRNGELSSLAKQLKQAYETRFGLKRVSKRIPMINWRRADLCCSLVLSHDPADLMDVGSGLGEFVNLLALTQQSLEVTSVDIMTYSLWFDHTQRIKRIFKSLFELGNARQFDVVTAFEVIEHLPTESLQSAVAKLRSLAKRKLFISVPFLEPLPLYKGHFTRFDSELLLDLFPEGKFTILCKGGKDPALVMSWILAEVDT